MAACLSINGAARSTTNWEIDGGTTGQRQATARSTFIPRRCPSPRWRVLTSNYGRSTAVAGRAPWRRSPVGSKEFHGTWPSSCATTPSTPAILRLRRAVVQKNDYQLHHRRPVFIRAFSTARRKRRLLLESELAQGASAPPSTSSAVDGERKGKLLDVCQAINALVDTKNYPDCPVIPSPATTIPATPWRSIRTPRR